jgi:hypothetical protein
MTSIEMLADLRPNDAIIAYVFTVNATSALSNLYELVVSWVQLELVRLAYVCILHWQVSEINLPILRKVYCEYQ